MLGSVRSRLSPTAAEICNERVRHPSTIKTPCSARSGAATEASSYSIATCSTELMAGLFFQSSLCLHSRSAMARTDTAIFLFLSRSASSSEDELDKLTRSFEEQASHDLQQVAEASRKATVQGKKQKSMKEARETGLQEPISEQSKCVCRSSVGLASCLPHSV